MPLMVVRGDQPSLLGRDWLETLKLDWRNVRKLMHVPQLDALLSQYSDLFKDKLGEMKGVKASIYMDPRPKPQYCRPRQVAYALRNAVKDELDRLVARGTIESVKHSKWATPIVKLDKTVRICGDYKLTVNKMSRLEQYPLPRTEDLFAKLSAGQKFTELDLSHAYEQMVLDEASQEYVTITTHLGLYRYKRLPYGVSSSPAISKEPLKACSVTFLGSGFSLIIS